MTIKFDKYRFAHERTWGGGATRERLAGKESLSVRLDYGRGCAYLVVKW